MRIAYGYAKSPFGKVLVARTLEGVCFLSFADSRPGSLKGLEASWPEAELERDDRTAKKLSAWIFRRRKTKLFLKGTPFQVRVWKALLRIPEGSLSTYGRIAKQVRKPRGARAVGNAVGANPVAFLVPCHRVVRGTGELGGYSGGGPKRKRAILDWESKKLIRPMSKRRRERLQKAGWMFGSADDFLRQTSQSQSTY